MSEVDQEMLQDFVIEAEENLGEIEPNLLQLEQDPGNMDLLNACFRNMHSVKGAAGYMGFQKISTLAHRMENLFDRVRQGEMSLGEQAMGAVFQGVDRLRSLVSEVAEQQQETGEIEDMLALLDAAMEAAAAPAPPAGGPAPEAAGGAGPAPDFEEEEGDDQELLAIYAEEIQSQLKRFDGALGQDPVDAKLAASAIEEMQRATHYVGLEEVLEGLEKAAGRVAELGEGGDAAAWASVREEVQAALAPVAEFLQAAGAPEEKPELPVAEEDRELYEIFLEFVKELAPPLANVPDEPDEEWLTTCKDVIGRLRSSAHYMDYREVVALLDEWEERMAEALSRVSEHAPFDAGYLRELWARFVDLLPGLDIGVAPGPAAAAPAPEPAEAPAAEENPADVLEAALDQLFEQEGLLGNGEAAAAGGGMELDLGGALEEGAGAGEAPPPPPGPKPPAAEGGAPKPPPAGAAGPKPPLGDLGAGDEVKVVADTGAGSALGKVVTQTVRIDLDKVEQLLNEVGGLVVLRSSLNQLADEMKGLYHQWLETRKWRAEELRPYKDIMFRVSEQTGSLDRVVRQVQDSVMRLRMLPVNHLFSRYPRLVRDLARKLGKKVELIVAGAETALDKQVIEQMADPMLHIIRNALDHGIESPEERKKAGKPEVGRLRLAAAQEGNHVVIRVADDGKGLNRDILLEKAVAKGLVRQEEVQGMSDEQVWDIIFLPGFSTAAGVSETSGRGVGMDVVRRNVEKLGGTIQVNSVPGYGTEFELRIPLTLAIIHVLLVRVGHQKLAVPLASVQETLRLKATETSTLEGFEIMALRQKTLPLIRLNKVFRGTGSDLDPDRFFVVVVRQGEIEAALAVDGLVGQQEVVIKPLPDYLTDQPGFAGATLLGDGSIALILDIPVVLDRAKSFIHRQQQILEQAALGLGEAGNLLH
ncbi:chemotaxis protein CheA [Dissulfurirhabdus thermomarina]|uniref:histidine kinase n=1 Tax=Dissulfurirhabdus thermomarina TaxID=1765737 RepID=A0A6N9TL39_DISTH|nr:chemotaxis protein CheA [Dissulfurirhabdus thermomarina]NDY41778.1 chemotaxis protein CheA [Dissulfurirhabdus thermomarina]NMX23980.1 chemotaxis protein CheA [Dissulfurirhabdus thermomarina]